MKSTTSGQQPAQLRVAGQPLVARQPGHVALAVALLLPVLAGVPAPAAATELLPGGAVALDSIAAGDPGTLLDFQADGVSWGGIEFTVRSAVYDPGDGLGYDFYYQIVWDEDPSDFRATFSGFAGLSTDVFTTIDAPDDVDGPIHLEDEFGLGTNFPTLVTRSAEPGDGITLFLVPLAGEPGSSLALSIQTNGSTYGIQAMGARLFNSAALPGDVFASIVSPFAAEPVPEPASLLLLGSGLAGMASVRRLRRRRTQH